MDILVYNELNAEHVKPQFDKVVDMLKRDDFYSAEVKKLVGTDYYRAKLDYTNRLLFKIVTFNQKRYALILEVIYQHAYEKSRFLNGAVIDDNKIESVNFSDLPRTENTENTINYLNPNSHYFHLLDKVVSFDETQKDIFHVQPPIIIIGSAGSGKTMLTLEKMKCCPGEVLYITGSPYLVQNARQLYYSNHYANEAQEIDFLSYSEFLETLRMPEGHEINFPLFSKWLLSLNKIRDYQDANKLYEEFKGVLAGNQVEKPYLSRSEYIGLGVKQSIYSVAERDKIYDLFEKYILFLKNNAIYDTNILSHEYHGLCEPKYDFIVIDEVQDFTPIQLSLILKSLKHPDQFILCGDSNQIVHPNFFSWSKIKTLFYTQQTEKPADIIRILNTNYRNSPSVTTIANRILKTKNIRFGSIDRESHYLVKSQSTTKGEVYCLVDNPSIRKEINDKTKKSTKFAIIVLQDSLKEKVKQHFQTPLVFSIFEAKGLEYDNVILYHFISTEEKRFRDIAEGVIPSDLEGDFVYSRIKDKTDRSLEIYKFFINALYVAITRAIKNVYFIEEIKEHALLNLIGLQLTEEFVAIEAQESSLEDWKKEAHRLAMQGKIEQADAILNNILELKPVPWKVVTPDYLTELEKIAFYVEKQDKTSKEAKILLFEYALHYQKHDLIQKLAHAGFSAAMKAKKDYELITRKYFLGYNSTNFSTVLRQVNLYGVDFKTPFNQTPLMTACLFGNIPLIRELIRQDADCNSVDNTGKNAFQIILQKSLNDKRFAQEKLSALYELLCPSEINFQINHKLEKIDSKRMEFILVNAMLALENKKPFCVDDFLNPFQSFPDITLSENRKQRAYISSILSKNEIVRLGPYNKKLFFRVRRGYYALQPNIAFKVNDSWINIYELLNQKIMGDLYTTRIEKLTEVGACLAEVTE